MDIKDQVFLILDVFIHGYKVPNSAQIVPAKIIEMLEGKITVEIALEDNKGIFKEVKEGEYYKNIHEAVKNLEPFINKKVKFLQDSEITQPIPTLEELTNTK